MKAIVDFPKVRVEIDWDTHVQLVEGISKAAEILQDDCCGQCGNKNIQFRVRENGGNKYYELACLDPKCRAVLTFGVNKVPAGQLYPKRKIDKDGNPTSKEGQWDNKHRGWIKYVPPSKDK